MPLNRRPEAAEIKAGPSGRPEHHEQDETMSTLIHTWGLSQALWPTRHVDAARARRLGGAILRAFERCGQQRAAHELRRLAAAHATSNPAFAAQLRAAADRSSPGG